MSKKEMIIISVLVNAGLLTILFITAIKSDPDAISSDVVIQEAAAEKIEVISFNDSVLVSNETKNDEIALDEVDNVLKEYLPEVPVDSVSSEPVIPNKNEVQVSNNESIENFVEVTIKKGDALEKIARNNRTTVEAIRKANHLVNDKLKIGQVLKIPVGTIKTKEQEITKVAAAPIAVNNSEPVYYTIKSGDNPWKIAKQHHVKFEDLLKLNHLNEETAKNLKVGDKIRVK